MKLDHYPPQEPLSPLGAAYQARILALGEGVAGHEAAYGDDPYQTLAVFRPPHRRDRPGTHGAARAGSPR